MAEFDKDTTRNNVIQDVSSRKNTKIDNDENLHSSDCHSKSAECALVSKIASSSVTAVRLAYLAVMFDFEDEVLYHPLSHVHLSINQKAERDEIGIPVVQLPSTNPQFSGAI